ncbi:MAG TPA: GNAT family N-acetyltransferase [Polyangiaceae bacterium LLY-WYZ-15_(1-7)]|nr:hypothetical protein [Sandaracinus sp.]HJK91687.1 GNAT family N-acetyltransferase [Polyangiaceae bacterium LLY-WYZ-15_(1-7)]MBJ70412.1 hypothetical protein [Sandaracinus sp.]HJL03050.1 GNAT family N-acetyltransferase [Polyangiaceae bacterium LLY-WYZ-15_(1-7)]HJL10246.1 GNAT family N-acetyltransferase [Polyangiaceae bacterium LLY-WYZ-15_(1-7)]
MGYEGSELRWVREDQPARWDGEKKRIVGGEAEGVFDDRYRECVEGDVIPGRWWRVERDGKVVGYGWMDVIWGDAEILLATAPDARGQGVGSFTLERLKDEAYQRGLRYLTNVVRPTHPEKDRIVAWLEKRGFASGSDGRHFRSVTRPSVIPAAAS